MFMISHYIIRPRYALSKDSLHGVVHSFGELFVSPPVVYSPNTNRIRTANSKKM